MRDSGILVPKYIVQLAGDRPDQPIEERDGEPIMFSRDNVGYAIDLSSEHADEF